MPRIDDFQNAIALARKELPLQSPEEICCNAGADLSSQSGKLYVVLPFFLQKVRISYPEGLVEYEQGENSFSLQEQGLLLHYLLGSTALPLTGELITFREIPSGEFYYQPFLNRAQVPLLKTFGFDHELFRSAALKLGGQEAAMGDLAMTFRPLPKIPITLVLWKGDDEFPPDGTILFDSSIKSFLPGEDIAFLASITIYRLMALSK